MKLARVARNVILASLTWRYIARRRARALARERRARRIVAPILFAGGAGLIWAARPRIVAGARRFLDGVSGSRERGEPQQDDGNPEHVQAADPTREQGVAATPSSGTTGLAEPKPSAKKQRKRARQQRAAQREKAEQEAAHGGSVKIEVNEEPELRAPLGDVKH